jgi:acetyl-CoA carboxylase biotin carboxyl carrier protein
MDLTDEDVAEVLALLDSLPYDELDLQTPRFRLTLRRTPQGWTQSSQSLAEPHPLEPAGPGPQETAPASPQETAPVSPQETAPVSPQETAAMSHRGGYSRTDVTSLRPDMGEAEVDGAEEVEEAEGLVAVRAPLPGTFYRAPRPGAAPFVEVGSRVSEDTVVGIVETMKLMTSVPAGADGTVAEICLANAEPAAQGATLMRIRADP